VPEVSVPQPQFAPGIPAYRPDIDGLRAVAVLAVVAFHAFPGRFRAGFVGVDIFFVISGFLITSIILGDLRQGRFSLAGFYVRRIRRIFPSLVLVLAAALVLGWPLLLSAEYRTLGRDVAAGTLFVSNFVFWSESGYFDALPELKPLLHLWSLSVEEQFYAAWPLLMALVWNRGVRAWIAIVAIGIASFAANVYLTNTAPTAAFYLPVPRFWELMAGALLAARHIGGDPRPMLPPGIACGAGAILVACAFAFVPKNPFPGWWAVLPVAGAALLIEAGPAAWLNRTVLSQPALVGIGLISYPLYLWHWLLLSYAYIFHGYYVATAWKIAIVVLSFALAWASYRYVESRFRRHGAPREKALRAAALMGGVLVASAAIAVGWVRNASLYYEIPATEAAITRAQQQFWEENDFHYSSRAVRVIVFGDSQARDIYHALRNDPAIGLRYFGSRAVCVAPAAQSTADSRMCRERFTELLDSNALKEADVLIYAFLWPPDGSTSFDPTSEIEALRSRNPRLRIQAWGAKPHLGDNDVSIRRIMRLYDTRVTINEYLNRVAVRPATPSALRARFAASGVPWTDVAAIYCSPECTFYASGEFAYFDVDHWTEFGAKLFYERLRASPAYSGLAAP
jgi:peptidoglycan/LPS O-acetylase OafA/YrhL